MMMFIVFRAVQLDRTRPWFESPEGDTAQPLTPTENPSGRPVRPQRPRR
jgi:hypothetical protein